MDEQEIISQIPYKVKDVEATLAMLGGSFQSSNLIALAIAIGANADESVKEMYLQELKDEEIRSKTNLQIMQKRVSKGTSADGETTTAKKRKQIENNGDTDRDS